MIYSEKAVLVCFKIHEKVELEVQLGCRHAYSVFKVL